MGEEIPASSGKAGECPDLDLPPEEFVARLQGFERTLLRLKEQLYEGSFDRILGDLRARLDNKPYVFKLSQAITRDLAAIERMKAYEERHHVDLSKLLKKQP